ncbi:MAG TPA: hypothetical protein VGB56_01145 [Flavisolibacter sp.]|jgi:hypothetical protein
MRWTLFLSRVAFICNVFFLIAFSLQVSNWINNLDIISIVLLAGYVLALLFNPLVNLCYFVLALLRRRFWDVVPHWLITANIFFLLMQVFYILYLNDTGNNQ